MYSRDETVEAITAFYRHLIKHPYLDEAALLIPPPTDLLRHLPYLNGRDAGYMIAYETIPVDFTYDATALIETIPEFPIPGHCVYITDGIGREGYRLIIDTEKGTTTAWSITGYEWSNVEWEYYKHRPLIEQWRADRTCPTTEFFAGWTLRYQKLVWFMSPRDYLAAGTLHVRANNWQEQEEFCHKEPTEWIPDLSEAEEIADPIERELKILRLQYPADVYNTYLRYGWGSESFDKQACKVTLARMEKHHGKEDKRLSKLIDPDDDFFDESSVDEPSDDERSGAPRVRPQTSR